MKRVEFEGTLAECKAFWAERGATNFYEHNHRDMSEIRVSREGKTLGTIKYYWRSGSARTYVYEDL